MRTTQTRKRSRFGGSSRPFKKRRFVRKRRNGVSTGFASKATTLGYIKFKGLSKKRRSNYHKRLIRSTDLSTKYRGATSGSVTISTPANLTTATQYSTLVLNSGGVNLTSPASWVAFNGQVASMSTAAGGAICRGGYSEMCLSHENAETVWYNVYLCWTKNGVPADGNVAKTADPNAGNNFNSDVRMLRKYEGFLEANSAKTFRFKIPPHKLDAQDFAASNNVWFWCIQLGNTVTSTAIAVTLVGSEVAWFAGVDIVS